MVGAVRISESRRRLRNAARGCQVFGVNVDDVRLLLQASSLEVAAASQPSFVSSSSPQTSTVSETQGECAARHASASEQSNCPRCCPELEGECEEECAERSRKQQLRGDEQEEHLFTAAAVRGLRDRQTFGSSEDQLEDGEVCMSPLSLSSSLMSSCTAASQKVGLLTLQFGSESLEPMMVVDEVVDNFRPRCEGAGDAFDGRNGRCVMSLCTDAYTTTSNTISNASNTVTKCTAEEANAISGSRKIDDGSLMINYDCWERDDDDATSGNISSSSSGSSSSHSNSRRRGAGGGDGSSLLSRNPGKRRCARAFLVGEKGEEQTCIILGPPSAMMTLRTIARMRRREQKAKEQSSSSSRSRRKSAALAKSAFLSSGDRDAASSIQSRHHEQLLPFAGSRGIDVVVEEETGAAGTDEDQGKMMMMIMSPAPSCEVTGNNTAQLQYTHPCYPHPWDRFASQSSGMFAGVVPDAAEEMMTESEEGDDEYMANNSSGNHSSFSISAAIPSSRSKLSLPSTIVIDSEDGEDCDGRRRTTSMLLERSTSSSSSSVASSATTPTVECVAISRLVDVDESFADPMPEPAAPRHRRSISGNDLWDAEWGV